MAKYGMVLNLDRCIGCYACVVACKMCYGTRPGVDYNSVKTVEWGEYPDAKQRFVHSMCMHCENPPCVPVCPTGATYKTDEGPVIVDYDKCIGCGACVTACPYGARHLVTDDVTSYEGEVAPYEEESSKRLNLVEKCTFCYGRVQNGEKPMCTVHCPGVCRIFGDVEDPESEISVYIKEKGAVRVEGTSIWYVAPADMPQEYLPLTLEVAIAAAAAPTPSPAPTAAPTAAPTSAPVVEETAAPSGGLSTGAIVGIAAGAAAVIGGAAYAVNKSKSKDKE